MIFTPWSDSELLLSRRCRATIDGMTSAAEPDEALICLVSSLNGAKIVSMLSMKLHWFALRLAGWLGDHIHAECLFLLDKVLHHMCCSSIVETSCCSLLTGSDGCCWIVWRREYASGECWQCPTIFLPMDTASLMLHSANTPLCTVSCSVCAMQCKLHTPV